MSMRPFLSYISAIYPDPWSEALCTGKGQMEILGTRRATAENPDETLVMAKAG